MKKIFYIILFIFIFTAFDYAVNAATPPLITEIPNSFVVCDRGTTDGLLYPNEWSFVVSRVCPASNPKCSKYTYGLEYAFSFSYSTMKICPSTGCTDDSWGGTFKSNGVGSLDRLFNHSAFENVFAKETNSIEGVYTNSSLSNALSNSICPKFIYVASSKSKQKIGFIFSSKEINNAKELLENAGYTVVFEQDGGDDISEVAETNYNNQLQKMKDNIQKFKDNDWGNVYSEECSSINDFGFIFHLGSGDYTENGTLMYYQKYKEELYQINPSYDFSEGNSIYEDYITNYICAPKPDESNDSELGSISLNKITCATIFKDSEGNDNRTHQLLSTTLRFMQYLAVTLALVLSIIDFIKVVPTQDKDAIKKASSKAVTRLVIAIIIFFVPIILDFILGLVGFNDPTCGLL